jgi:lipopolysaccharide/colanic/teichoic acid biosynthesis glycosyltransferase
MPLPKNQIMCRLLWRQEKLLVVPPAKSGQQTALPALASPEWFQACLDRSKAKAVVIDPKLGSEVVGFWAQACHDSAKPLYLRLPTMRTLPEKQKVWAWRIKCTLDRIVGLMLLIVLSPVILLFTLLLTLQNEGPAVTYHWSIGNRGRVFQMAQFRRESVFTGNETALGKVLEISRLDRLPRLLNVVQGEMTLVGTKPWIIENALKIPQEYRSCLKGLPGVIGERPLGLNVPMVDVHALSQLDWRYLQNWTLWGDGKTMLLTMANFLSGMSKSSL